MKYVKAVLSFVLFVSVLSFFGSFTFGANDVVCCYNANDKEITFNVDSCSSSEALLGTLSPSNDKTPYEACTDLAVTKRQICQSTEQSGVGVPVYIDNVDGQTIYSLANNLHSFSYIDSNGATIPFSYEPTCMPNSYEDYNAAKVGTYTTNTSGIGVGTGPTGTTSDETNDMGTTGTPFEGTGEPNMRLSLCNAFDKGSFGFFVDMNLCQSIGGDRGGNIACVYNPQFSNNIYSYIEYTTPFMFQNQRACVPRGYVDSCTKYTTQYQCEHDPARLVGECSWLNSASYAQELIPSSTTGLCVPKYNVSGSHFKKEWYEDNRGNILVNPSFEIINSTSNFASSWQKEGDAEIVSDSFNAYDKNNYLVLKAGASITQTINRIGNAYFFQVAARAENSSTLKITAVTFNPENPESHSVQTDEMRITSSKSFKYYDSFDVVSLKNYSSITFTITAVGSDIELDAVALQRAKGNYYPFSIVPPKASFCNLCANNTPQMHTCTQQKASLLGDCEYMVPDMTTAYASFNGYFGDAVNPFLAPVHSYGKGYDFKAWSSQALPASEVFCEMYNTNTTCLDPNNVMNSKIRSLHPYAGKTLCKWLTDKVSGNQGCFKDSNNDNLADVVFNKNVFPSESILRRSDLSVFDERIPLFPSLVRVYTTGTDSYPDFYTGDGSSDDSFKGVITSMYEARDTFKYYCDYAPPQVYMYFTGTTKEKNTVYFTNMDEYAGTQLGNVTVHIRVQDSPSDTCKYLGYNTEFDPHVYIDFTLGGKSYIKSYDVSNPSEQSFTLNQIASWVGLGTEYSAKTDLDIVVMDQSGNYGKDTIVNVNSDGAGPKIAIVDPVSFDRNDVYAIKNMSFSVHDDSGIEKCSYVITKVLGVAVFDGQKMGPISGNFSSDYFTSTPQDVSSMFLDLGVNMTGPNGATLKVAVTCSDIFGQKRLFSELVTLDYNTDVFFTHKEYYASNNLSFKAYSTERQLKECFVKFSPEPSVSYLQQLDLQSNTPAVMYNGLRFYSNITTLTGFNVSGFAEGHYVMNVTCRDNSNNQYSKTTNVSIDRTVPKVNDFTLKGFGKTVLGQNLDSMSWQNKTYYTITANTIAQVSLNGTGSRLSNVSLRLKAYFWNGTSTTDLRITNFVQNWNELGYGLVQVNLTNYLQALNNGSILHVNPTSERFLKRVILELNYSDMAKNTAFTNVSYYFDETQNHPDLLFSGNVTLYDQDNVKYLFTSMDYPRFNVDFTSPKYRLFNCNVTLFNGNAPFGARPTVRYTDLNSLQNIGFDTFVNDLSLISIDNNLYSFRFKCTDYYNNVFTKQYYLIKDISPPSIKGVYFNSSFGSSKTAYQSYAMPRNPIFSGSGFDRKFSLVFSNLVSKDTYKEPYTCNYYFKNSEDYICNSTLSATLRGTTNPRLFPSSSASVPRLLSFTKERTSDSYCYLTESGYDKVLNGYTTQAPTTVTTFAMNMSCKDGAGHQNSSVEYFNLTFVNSIFISGQLEYLTDGVIIHVNSLVNGLNFAVYPNADGSNPILTSNQWSCVKSGAYYTCSSPKIDRNLLMNRESVFVKGLSNGDVMDSITLPVELDNIAPTVELSSYDIEDGIAYGRNVTLHIFAQDMGRAKLNKIQVYLSSTQDDLVYNISRNAQEFFDPELVFEDRRENVFSPDFSTYERDVMFTNLQFDRSYTFKVVATDISGNEITESVVATVKDGILVIPLSTSTAKVDTYLRSWFVKDKTANFAFKTSQPVTSCTVFPSGVSLSTITPQLVDGKYTFTLTMPQSISLMEMSIECAYTKDGGDQVTHPRRMQVEVIDALPDYTLTSSKGFILNEDPFMTNLTIKSVGPYRPIRCNLSYGSDVTQFYQTNLVEKFSKVLDLSSKSGTGVLTLQCKDELGITGPVKTYTFDVRKTEQLQVKNLWLTKGTDKYLVRTENGQHVVYLPQQSAYSFEVELNKKNTKTAQNAAGVECSMHVEKGAENIFATALNWVRNIFGLNTQVLSTPVTSSYGFTLANPQGTVSIYPSTIMTLSCFDGVTPNPTVIQVTPKIGVEPALTIAQTESNP